MAGFVFGLLGLMISGFCFGHIFFSPDPNGWWGVPGFFTFLISWGGIYEHVQPEEYKAVEKSLEIQESENKRLRKKVKTLQAKVADSKDPEKLLAKMQLFIVEAESRALKSKLNRDQ